MEAKAKGSVMVESNHRLNQYDRKEILNRFLDHTFETETNSLKELESTLALKARTMMLDKTVSVGGKVYKEIDLIELLPEAYFPTYNYISVNAGGYNNYLHFENRIELRQPYKLNSRYDVTDRTLINEIQTFSNRQQTLKEKIQRLSTKMRSFLNGVRTVGKLFETMPELKEILGDKWTVSMPSKALVVTAAEILCEVAMHRGEERDGCKNGVITL